MSRERGRGRERERRFDTGDERRGAVDAGGESTWTARASALAPPLADACLYAVGLTAVAVAVAVPPGILLWGGLPGVKFALFLVGFAYFGYASWLLQPSRPTGDTPDADPDAGGGPGPGGGPDGGGGPAPGRGGTARPATAGRRDAGRDLTRFEAVLDGVVGRYWTPPPPAVRFGRGAKLMLASLVTLGLSFALEAVFGVAAA